MIPGTQLESASLIYYKLKVAITKARNITPNFFDQEQCLNYYTFSVPITKKMIITMKIQTQHHRKTERTSKEGDPFLHL